jgi:hypothetical protein
MPAASRPKNMRMKRRVFTPATSNTLPRLRGRVEDADAAAKISIPCRASVSPSLDPLPQAAEEEACAGAHDSCPDWMIIVAGSKRKA